MTPNFRINRRPAGVLALLAVILLLSCLAGLAVGGADIRILEIPSILFGPKDSLAHQILTGIRAPRIILGVSIGGALGVSGVILQAMFRNPLVEPYTLGISGGASLGVCLNILLRLHAEIGVAAYPISGFLGAGAVIFLVYRLNRRIHHSDSNRMLLTGVMISYVASSLVMLLMAVAGSDELHNIVMWIMGSLDETHAALVAMAFFGSTAGLAVSYCYCLDLNALLLGETEAESLGVDLAKTRRALFLTASFLTGLSVSIGGVIMFVGLVVPHFIRSMTGSDHRFLLMGSFLAGGSFLVLSDMAARVVISPLELPVGVITGIVGGGVFIRILSGKKEVW